MAVQFLKNVERFKWIIYVHDTIYYSEETDHIWCSDYIIWLDKCYSLWIYILINRWNELCVVEWNGMERKRHSRETQQTVGKMGFWIWHQQPTKKLDRK